MENNSICIIANPFSGKDIRRIVSYGSVSSTIDKVDIVRRVLLAVAATGIQKVYYLPDMCNIVTGALNTIYETHKHIVKDIELVPVPVDVQGKEQDSVRAAYACAELGVKCVITLGGDGTNRAVAKGIGENIALIPIATGTNNVFSTMMEGTTAGLAAGAYASGKLDDVDCLKRTKRIEIYKDGAFFDLALIDAVVVKSSSVASRALWETDQFSQILLTCCAPEYLGVTSIGGKFCDITKESEQGMEIHIGEGGEERNTPLIPGLLVPVRIKGHRLVKMEEEVKIAQQSPYIIAVDGERNITIRKGETAHMKITWNGPKLLDIHKTLKAANERGLF